MNLSGLDIYVRSADKDGRITLTAHRVWDVDRFMAAREADVAKVGGESSAKRITREEFLAGQQRKHA